MIIWSLIRCFIRLKELDKRETFTNLAEYLTSANNETRILGAILTFEATCLVIPFSVEFAIMAISSGHLEILSIIAGIDAITALVYYPTITGAMYLRRQKKLLNEYGNDNQGWRDVTTRCQHEKMCSERNHVYARSSPRKLRCFMVYRIQDERRTFRSPYYHGGEKPPHYRILEKDGNFLFIDEDASYPG